MDEGLKFSLQRSRIKAFERAENYSASTIRPESNRSFLSLHFPWLSFIPLLHNLATYAASTSRRTPTTVVDNEQRTDKYLERSLRRYASSTLEFLNVVLISSTLRQGLKTAIARAFLLVESWLGNKTRDTIKFIPENER